MAQEIDRNPRIGWDSTHQQSRDQTRHVDVAAKRLEGKFIRNPSLITCSEPCSPTPALDQPSPTTAFVNCAALLTPVNEQYVSSASFRVCFDFGLQKAEF
jgi:hypothetical protein